MRSAIYEHRRLNSQANAITFPDPTTTTPRTRGSSSPDRMAEPSRASSPGQSSPEEARITPLRAVQIDAACHLADHLQQPMALCDDAARHRYPRGLWYYVPYASASFPQFDRQPMIRLGADHPTRQSPLLSLPAELHRQIVDHTDVNDLGRLSQVNHYFRDVCADLLRTPRWANEFAEYLCATPDTCFKSKYKGGVLRLRPLHPLAKEILPKVSFLHLHRETDFSRVLRLMSNVTQVIGHSIPSQYGDWPAVAACVSRKLAKVSQVIGTNLSMACLREFSGKASGIRAINLMEAGFDHSQQSYLERIDEWVNPLAMHLAPWLHPGANRLDCYNVFDIKEIEEIVMRLPPVPTHTNVDSVSTSLNTAKLRELCVAFRALVVADIQGSLSNRAILESTLEDIRIRLYMFARRHRFSIDRIDCFETLLRAFKQVAFHLVALDAASLEDMLIAFEQRLQTPVGKQRLGALRLTVMPKHTAFFSVFSSLTKPETTQYAFESQQSLLFTHYSTPQREIRPSAVLRRIWSLAPQFQLTIAYEDGLVRMTAPPPTAVSNAVATSEPFAPREFEPQVLFNRL